MNGLLASLRFPFTLRGPWTPAAAVAATAAPTRAVDAPVRGADPFRTLAHQEAEPRAYGTPMRPPIDRAAAPVVATVEATLEAPEPALLPALPVEPSVRVSAAHLVDPVGLRVVPFRPSTRWPLRRATPRIYDPFRGFPLRSVHLADLMDGRADPR